MKEGWHTKKLGELGRVITGSTPSTRDEDNYSSPDVCFVKPSDIEKNGITTISNTEFHISHKAFQQSRKLPQGSVLTTCIGIIGKVGILGVDATCNQQINAIVPDVRVITSSFLAYSILSKQHILSSIANAPVVPIINKGEFSSVAIPVPPIAEQEKIVAELDCLTGIIEKKKQQLKELDNLAQSIFYDMFGDPITNEKGWEVKKLGDTCSPKKEIARANKCFKKSDTIQYIDISSIDNSQAILMGTTPFVFEDAPSRAQQKVNKGDVLVSLVRPNLKNIAMVHFEDAFLVASSGFCVLRGKLCNPHFIKSLVLTDRFTKYLTERTSGANYPAVREEDIKDCSIGVPPIDLQNTFAEKIEAIEKQKELIKKSIQETETLFNSRMDYWFN